MTETALTVVPEIERPGPMVDKPRPSYVQGFDGMATQPFDKDVIAKLRAPIDPAAVEIKPDGIVYLPGIFYRDRLMDAFGCGGWALPPRGPARTMGDLVVYHGALFALGRFVSESHGECMFRANNRGMTYAMALEGARTDCMTRCCKDLGIARELWDPTWRENWKKKWAYLGKNRKGEPAWYKKGAPESKEADDGPTEPAPARWAPPGDSGELITEDDAKAIGALALNKAPKGIGWAKPHATGWLKKYFGADTPFDLTKQMGGTARELLETLHRDGQDKYNDLLKTLTDLGHVKRVA